MSTSVRISDCKMWQNQDNWTAHTQHIIHQCALPRSNLHQLHSAALPSLRHPFRNCPDPHQFSEDLRYLGRGDEITFLAEYFAVAFWSRRVVASFGVCEDLAHKGGDRNGSGYLVEC